MSETIINTNIKTSKDFNLYLTALKSNHLTDEITLEFRLLSFLPDIVKKNRQVLIIAKTIQNILMSRN